MTARFTAGMTVTGDAVLSQAQGTLAKNGNTSLTATRERFHHATCTGGLGTSTTGVPARVSYLDAADRQTTGSARAGEQEATTVNDLP